MAPESSRKLLNKLPGGLMEQKIKVRFKAYDEKLLDKTIGEIVHTGKRTGNCRPHSSSFSKDQLHCFAFSTC